jgi:hypothetical protein
VETLSDGAREVIREKISEEVRRQYLEVTWNWFEQEALPDYLHHRERSLWDRYERRLQEMPATATRSSAEDLREESEELLADHSAAEEKLLRMSVREVDHREHVGTIRNLCAESQAASCEHPRQPESEERAGRLLSSLRQLWASSSSPLPNPFRPTPRGRLQELTGTRASPSLRVASRV